MDPEQTRGPRASHGGSVERGPSPLLSPLSCPRPAAAAGAGFPELALTCVKPLGDFLSHPNKTQPSRSSCRDPPVNTPASARSFYPHPSLSSSGGLRKASPTWPAPAPCSCSSGPTQPVLRTPIRLKACHAFCCDHWPHASQRLLLSEDRTPSGEGVHSSFSRACSGSCPSESTCLLHTSSTNRSLTCRKGRQPGWLTDWGTTRGQVLQTRGGDSGE